jgi:predicted DNA-binding transcriptional regulator AlpA
VTILTIDELAAFLKLSRSQVYTMCRRRSQERMPNPLPCLRLNGNLRFNLASVEEWLRKVESNERP